MKTLKKILIAATILGLIAAAYGYYLYNKPHTSTSDKDIDASVTAEQIVSEYEADENAANQKYLGKVIEVTGVVSDKSVDEKGVLNMTLKGGDLAGVTCQFEKNEAMNVGSIQTGSTVKIKGECTGILMDVVFVNCIFSETEQ